MLTEMNHSGIVSSVKILNFHLTCIKNLYLHTATYNKVTFWNPNWTLLMFELIKLIIDFY